MRNSTHAPAPGRFTGKVPCGSNRIRTAKSSVAVTSNSPATQVSSICKEPVAACGDLASCLDFDSTLLNAIPRKSGRVTPLFTLLHYHRGPTGRDHQHAVALSQDLIVEIDADDRVRAQLLGPLLQLGERNI